MVIIYFIFIYKKKLFSSDKKSSIKSSIILLYLSTQQLCPKRIVTNVTIPFGQNRHTDRYNKIIKKKKNK